MSISQLPAPPSRSQRPVDLTQDTDNFLNALPNFQAQANELAKQVSDNAENTAINAQTAAQDARTAETYAGLSNYQGEWQSGAYTQGASVKHNGRFWLCDEFGNTAEPGVSGWSVISTGKHSPSVKPWLRLNFAENDYSIYESAENSFIKKPCADILALSNNSGSVIDAFGKVMPTTQTTSPRLTFDAQTGESLGHLFEKPATNLLLDSENFTSANWSAIRANLIPSAGIAPDGSNNALKFNDTTDVDLSHELRTDAYISVVAGETYTQSIFVKPGELDSLRIIFPSTNGEFNGSGVTYNLRTLNLIGLYGDIADYGVEPLPNGWFRMWATCPAIADGLTRGQFSLIQNGGSDATYTGTGTDGVYIWGAEYKQGSFPSSYIKTEAAQVTRPTAYANRYLAPVDFNINDFSVFCSIRNLQDIFSGSMWQIDDDGIAGHAFRWVRSNAANNSAYYVTFFEESLGYHVYAESGRGAQKNEDVMMALSVKNGYVTFAIDGFVRGEQQAITSYVNPRIEFSSSFNGCYKDFALFSRALPVAELINMSVNGLEA